MGWYYRKSVGLGPFRINISKSGIGYSLGGGGFRTGVNARGRASLGRHPWNGNAVLLVVEAGMPPPWPCFRESLRSPPYSFEMAMRLIRTFRTMTSERFLVQKKEGQDSAAIDLHYLADGHVAGTVFLLSTQESRTPKFPSSSVTSTRPCCPG